jgi:hypothetical protein
VVASKGVVALYRSTMVHVLFLEDDSTVVIDPFHNRIEFGMIPLGTAFVKL